jgi:HSP20 family protein
LRPLRSVFLDIERHVDEVFEKLVFRPWSIPREGAWSPPLDLYDTADAYLAVIDLPGVAPEDVSILVGERKLTISGQRQLAAPPGTATHFHERRGGAFHRSVDFPQPVEPGSARAECLHGTYHIHLPKKSEAAAAGAAPTPPPSCVIRVTIR